MEALNLLFPGAFFLFHKLREYLGMYMQRVVLFTFASKQFSLSLMSLTPQGFPVQPLSVMMRVKLKLQIGLNPRISCDV